MIITHKINMDLVSKGIAPKFDMVQGDYCTRRIEFHLFSNNTPWTIPGDALVVIRYRRPDKSVGVYNTLPDGTYAYATGGNTLTVTVAPEALAIPGTAWMVVTISAQEKELSTFEVQLAVQPNLSSGDVVDGNYSSISGMLAAPEATASGQVLMTNEIGVDGKVRSVKAVDLPGIVPEYVKTEAERLAALVQSRQSANTFSFIVGTDPHAYLYGDGADQSLASVKHAAQAMEIINKQVHLDFGAILGDLLLNNGETAEDALEVIRQIRACFFPAFVGIPQFWSKGDDDYLSSDGLLTDEQVFAGISIHNTGTVFDEANKLGGYCYRDFADNKLRVINLSLPSNSDGIREEQATWLNNVLEESATRAGWKCLILSHQPIDASSEAAGLVGAVTAYADKIIACIHGHTHTYEIATLDSTNIPNIGIPAISPHHGPGKVHNTADDTAFCVVTISPDQGKMLLDHYGAGVDQEIALP